MDRNSRHLPVLGLSIIIIVAFMTGSCYYDSEEALFPVLNDFCDTTNFTYSTGVRPVMEQYCLSCHSNATSASFGANIKLEDYSDVLLRARDGSLVGAISHDSKYSPMPKGAGKLSDCINTSIRKWVDDGSLNN